MTARRLLIICEGKTDSAFYGALFQKSFGFTERPETDSVWDFFRRGRKEAPFRYLCRSDAEAVILAAGSKEQVFSHFKDCIKRACEKGHAELCASNWLLSTDLNERDNHYFGQKLAELRGYLLSLDTGGQAKTQANGLEFEGSILRIKLSLQPQGFRSFSIAGFTARQHKIEEWLLQLALGIDPRLRETLVWLLQSLAANDLAKPFLAPQNLSTGFAASLLGSFLVSGSGTDALAKAVVGKANTADIESLLDSTGLKKRIEFLLL